MDDVVLAVVRDVFKETAPIRFEGNNYSEEWVEEAEKRGLPNLRRSPEALEQLVTGSRARCSRSSASSPKRELESRYHVRLERYVKDMLIEMHTLQEMVDTIVLPAAYAYSGSLARRRGTAGRRGSRWCRRWTRRTRSAR